jgi:hypothetical protein
VLGLVERASEVFGFVSLIGTLREEIKSGPKNQRPPQNAA